MKTAKQHNAELCGEVYFSTDTGHAEDYKSASIGRLGANRMSLGLPCIPDPSSGDMVNYARLAELTLKVWSDLVLLKASVHEGYHKVLQMSGEERSQVMVIATRVDTIERVIHGGPSA